jgi:hypothetical protein
MFIAVVSIFDAHVARELDDLTLYPALYAVQKDNLRLIIR